MPAKYRFDVSGLRAIVWLQRGWSLQRKDDEWERQIHPFGIGTIYTSSDVCCAVCTHTWELLKGIELCRNIQD